MQGPLEIIHLFGSILTSNDHGCLRVTLASSNSSVIGGIIAGPLRAATPVQVSPDVRICEAFQSILIPHLMEIIANSYFSVQASYMFIVGKHVDE